LLGIIVTQRNELRMSQVVAFDPLGAFDLRYQSRREQSAFRHFLIVKPWPHAIGEAAVEVYSVNSMATDRRSIREQGPQTLRLFRAFLTTSVSTPRIKS
jgi:hypothetical protein